MTCNHIKEAKAKIFKLTQSLASKDEKIIDNIGGHISVDEVNEIAKFFSEKKPSITTSKKKALNKATEKILSRATEKYIIDQNALVAYLGDINQLLEQCDCYNESQKALDRKLIENEGLTDKLELARVTIKEERETGTALIRQREINRNSEVPGLTLSQHIEETQKLNSKINFLEQQVKELEEKNYKHELRIKEEKLEKIAHRVGNSEQIFNLRDYYIRAKERNVSSILRQNIKEIEKEISKNVERDEMQEIRSCCENIADLQFKLEQLWNQETSERSSYMEIPANSFRHHYYPGK